jgi:hypothetical protein
VFWDDAIAFVALRGCFVLFAGRRDEFWNFAECRVHEMPLGARREGLRLPCRGTCAHAPAGEKHTDRDACAHAHALYILNYSFFCCPADSCNGIFNYVKKSFAISPCPVFVLVLRVKLRAWEAHSDGARARGRSTARVCSAWCTCFDTRLPSRACKALISLTLSTIMTG